MRDPRLTIYARQNRQQMTEPAKRLWYKLRAARFQGLKFRREKVIGDYIADFAANNPRLVIEVDGETHDKDDIRDQVRTQYLEQRGYRVQRYTNLEVMRNIEGVLTHLSNLIAEMQPPLPTLSPEGERASNAHSAGSLSPSGEWVGERGTQ